MNTAEQPVRNLTLSFQMTFPVWYCVFGCCDTPPPHCTPPPNPPPQAPRKPSILLTPPAFFSSYASSHIMFPLPPFPDVNTDSKFSKKDILRSKWYVAHDKSVKRLFTFLVVVGGKHHLCSNVILRRISAWQTRQNSNIQSQSAQYFIRTVSWPQSHPCSTHCAPDCVTTEWRNDLLTLEKSKSPS